MIELSGRQASTERASSIAKEMWPLLVEGLDHPFKACREEIARWGNGTPLVVYAFKSRRRRLILRFFFVPSCCVGTFDSLLQE